MKFLKTGFISLLMCIMFAFTANAASGMISFSDPEVTAGSEVNVSMKINADAGTALNSANIVLTYPAGSLEFVSGTDADGGAGAVRVHGVSNGKGTAQLEYNLKFKTLEAGTFNVNVDTQEVYDANDQVIEMSHVGSSAITVNADSNASADCSLSSLDIYPGTLEPAFSPDVTSYTTSVGLNVDKLTINAITNDGTASVKIANNENLPEGESAIVITVNAADGTSKAEYTITVSKAAGGAEADSSAAAAAPVDVAEGVQLSSKGKTITIINPSEDLVVPEGFKQGTISIDDQKVQGWVWGASEAPEYCVVYGMNDKGEINFYRYDMVEKTIQRYFEDPLAANSVSNADYTALKDELTAAERSSEIRLIIIAVLAVIAFAAFMACIYMYIRLRTAEKMQSSYRKQSSRYRAIEKEDDPEEISSENLEDVKELLKHDYESDGASGSGDSADETQVIRRPERKRRARRNRVVETNDMGDDFDDMTEVESLDELAGLSSASDDENAGE